VQSFDDYRRDVSLVLTSARRHHDGLPICLVGHSMGGLVALRYFLDHPHLLDAAILSSPALGAHPDQRPPRSLQVLAHILSRVAPRLLFASDLDVNSISHDPQVVQAYRDDPLVSNKVSARWFTAIEDAMATIQGRVGEVSQPMLLMQSGADRLVDAAASRRWAAAAPQDLVEYVEWPGFFHEMFNEPERQDVFRKMEAWLTGVLGSASRQAT
jgi:lysophospholipase